MASTIPTPSAAGKKEGDEKASRLEWKLES